VFPLLLLILILFRINSNSSSPVAHQLNVENFVHLLHWIRELNSGIKMMLLGTSQEAVIRWIGEFPDSKLGAGVHCGG